MHFKSFSTYSCHVLVKFINQKNPRFRKSFLSAILGPERLRQFYGRLENAFFLQERPFFFHKIPRFRGGILVSFFFGRGGGGSADVNLKIKNESGIKKKNDDSKSKQPV